MCRVSISVGKNSVDLELRLGFVALTDLIEWLHIIGFISKQHREILTIVIFLLFSKLVSLLILDIIFCQYLILCTFNNGWH